MSSLRRKPPKWTCRPPASVICDKYALLRRRSRAMEIDAAGNLRFFFCLSAPSLLFLFSFFLPPARTSGKKSACTREDFADDAPDVTALILVLCSDVHTRLEIAGIWGLPVRLAYYRVDGIWCKPLNSGPPFSSVSFVVPERAESWCVQPVEPRSLNQGGCASRTSQRRLVFHWALSYTHQSCVSDAM